jgi:hypothetical protein
MHVFRCSGCARETSTAENACRACGRPTLAGYVAPSQHHTAPSPHAPQRNGYHQTPPLHGQGYPVQGWQPNQGYVPGVAHQPYGGYAPHTYTPAGQVHPAAPLNGPRLVGQKRSHFTLWMGVAAAAAAVGTITTAFVAKGSSVSRQCEEQTVEASKLFTSSVAISARSPANAKLALDKEVTLLDAADVTCQNARRDDRIEGIAALRKTYEQARSRFTADNDRRGQAALERARDFLASAKSASAKADFNATVDALHSAAINAEICEGTSASADATMIGAELVVLSERYAQQLSTVREARAAAAEMKARISARAAAEAAASDDEAPPSAAEPIADFIRSTLPEPFSFEYVDGYGSAVRHGSGWQYTMTYRGKNGLGLLVTRTRKVCVHGPSAFFCDV